MSAPVTTIGRRLGAAVVLAGMLLPVHAQTFRIDASEDLRYFDVDVTVTAVNTMLIIRIRNNDPLPVRCSSRIDMGPDSARRRVTVDGGESRTMSYAVRRTATQVVKVHTTCRSDVDDEDDAADGTGIPADD